MFHRTFFCILFFTVLCSTFFTKAAKVIEWKVIESLAEEYPHIVALLNNTKDYFCTGTTISRRTVLTSGFCTTLKPTYVAAVAVVGKTGRSNIVDVATTKLHPDYIFMKKTHEPNETQMHSNIGLVFVKRPVLDFLLTPATIGTYFASELVNVELTVVGYGRTHDNNKVVLQYQCYNQSPCVNPTWYYCICGIEIEPVKPTHGAYFGNGAPALYGNDIVAITATASGTADLESAGVKYNIFTVIAPYVSWIEKADAHSTSVFMRAKENKAGQNYESHDNKIFVRNMSQGKKWEPLKKVGIIGVPFEKGQKKYGVSVAPAAMRSVGLIEHLQEIDGLDIKDYGDIETAGTDENVTVDNMAHLSLVSACNKRLSERVSQVLNDGRVAVTIGGDHSIGVGTVDGHYSVNEDMILIWVDAHADINTNKTSGSGSVHGMPVALLVKELSDYWPYLPTMDWQVPKFSIKNLGYLGLRSVDKYERLAIEKYNVPTFAMEDVEEYGIKSSIRHILQKLDPEKKKPIHVSFDIDSLDALEAPSTGTPVRGGLTLREAINLMEIIYSTGRLRAVDLVEINPAMGNETDRKRTLEAGLAVLRAALGFSRKGTAPRGVKDLPIQTHHDLK